MRSLVKQLDGISDADIVQLNIPTGLPLIYRLDDRLRPVDHHYLGWSGRFDRQVQPPNAHPIGEMQS